MRPVRTEAQGYGGNCHEETGEPDEPARTARRGALIRQFRPRFDTSVGVLDDPCVSVLLVPDAASRMEDGAIQGSRSTGLCPGLDQRHQVPPQAANLRRKTGRDGCDGSWTRVAGRFPC